MQIHGYIDCGVPNSLRDSSCNACFLRRGTRVYEVRDGTNNIHFLEPVFFTDCNDIDTPRMSMAMIQYVYNGDLSTSHRRIRESSGKLENWEEVIKKRMELEEFETLESWVMAYRQS